MSGRNPPSYCTLTLIAMQGHQQKGRQNNTSSNNKDKYNTIIETRTGEDPDDENLHNPETVQDAFCFFQSYGNENGPDSSSQIRLSVSFDVDVQYNGGFLPDIILWTLSASVNLFKCHEEVCICRAFDPT